jgi:hypothetical protein
MNYEEFVSVIRILIQFAEPVLLAKFHPLAGALHVLAKNSYFPKN